MEHIIGDNTPGRMERLRQHYGMTVDEFMEFFENQKKAHEAVIEAEELLRKARENFYQSCFLKKKSVEKLSLPAKGED